MSTAAGWPWRFGPTGVTAPQHNTPTAPREEPNHMTSDETPMTRRQQVGRILARAQMAANTAEQPQRTAHANVPRTVIPPVAFDEIRLEAGGTGWMGTFALTARFMVNNILEDGEPVTATFGFELPGDGQYLRLVTGQVTNWTTRHIGFSDGTVLDLDDMVGDLVMVTL